MKKIVALIIALGILSMMSASFAQINKKIDSFSEDTVWSSYSELNSIDSLQFYKIVSKYGFENYKLLLCTETTNERQVYSKIDAQIKVDGEMFNARVEKIGYSKFDYSKDLAEVNIEISQDLASKIAKAQKVSLRFYADKGYTNTIDVPDNVLAEWKQVINTEK